MSDKIRVQHLDRKAVLYVRQSSAYQVSHNLESQKLQYAMQDRLRQLGWKEIEVIDEDLGCSAAGTQTRTGFERMVAEVCLGRVGAVAAREVSRFARNSREWQQLVEVCRVVDTVLIDQETVYSPRLRNDRLLLGLKGSLNEYELDLLRQRSLEARHEKARRGELVIIAPVGYRKTEDQRLEKVPDLRVQEAIGSVFRQFLAIGSVRQTLLWFLEHDLLLPACTPRGEIHWKRPSYGTIHQILTNPVYGGAYAYGKTECTVHYEAGEPRKRDRRKPRDQWLSLIPNAHDGYVDWDEFERIQRAIRANVRMGAHAGAPKNGEALVTGLLRCRRCASKLTVHYTGSRHDALRYSCHRAWLDKGLPRCIAFGGTRVDAAIAQAVLRVVQPAAIMPQVAQLRERFGINEMVLVGDRGMIAQTHIDALKAEPGLQWITALKSGTLRTLASEGALQLGLFDERNLFEFTHADYPGERLIACCNPQLAKKRAHTRQALLEATVRQLDPIRQRVAAGRLKGKERIGLCVGKVLNRYKVGKHFDLVIGDASFEYTINDARVAQEAALDGIYVIRTALPPARMNSDDVVRNYKNLSQVEQAFRSMKTVDLEVRPIYHRLADRVRAHLLLCMLAFYVKRHMMQAWRPLLFADEEQAAKAQRDPVAPARRSPSALRKVSSKTLDDGTPAHSFGSLLHHLSAIVRNVCRRPGVAAHEPTFTLDTTPDAKQQLAIELLKALAV